MCNWVKLSEQAPDQDQVVDVYTAYGTRVPDLVYSGGEFFTWDHHFKKFNEPVDYWCRVLSPYGDFAI